MNSYYPTNGQENLLGSIVEKLEPNEVSRKGGRLLLRAISFKEKNGAMYDTSQANVVANGDDGNEIGWYYDDIWHYCDKTIGAMRQRRDDIYYDLSSLVFLKDLFLFVMLRLHCCMWERTIKRDVETIWRAGGGRTNLDIVK